MPSYSCTTTFDYGTWYMPNRTTNWTSSVDASSKNTFSDGSSMNTSCS